MIKPEHSPLLIVVSAPSGCGKTTLCEMLLDEFPQMEYSVSCTTRLPRTQEVDGKDYYFISEEEFRKRLERGDFIEHARVHDHLYGTLKSTVLEAIHNGKDLLFDVDVQGATQIRDYACNSSSSALLEQCFVDVFIAPPSTTALRERLVKRSLNTEEEMLLRLGKADEEIQHWREYKYLIINDDLHKAYDVLRGILLAERHRIRKS